MKKADRQAGRQADRLGDNYTGWQTGDIQKGRQTDKQKGRQADLIGKLDQSSFFFEYPGSPPQ